MTEKEKVILQEIINYHKKNQYMPTVRELQRILHYKSTNSIYQYLIVLEKKGYLKRDNIRKKLVLVNTNLENNIVNLKAINCQETITLKLDNNKNYTCFKISNNSFNYLYIKKNDYLVIEKNKKLSNHDLGLFIINNKYRVMEYMYQDGFYILKDNEQEILYKVNIIGKVVSIYRKL